MRRILSHVKRLQYSPQFVLAAAHVLRDIATGEYVVVTDGGYRPLHVLVRTASKDEATEYFDTACRWADAIAAR